MVRFNLVFRLGFEFLAAMMQHPKVALKKAGSEPD